MSDFVYDCSIASVWLFDDEATVKASDLLEQLKDGYAFVPSSRYLEFGNVLIQAEQQKRITSTQISTRLELIFRLSIVTRTETGSRAFREMLTSILHQFLEFKRRTVLN